MKIILLCLIVLASFNVQANKFDKKDWLLWSTHNTSLPFKSTLTIYPPVTLYKENSELRAAIATPYAFEGGYNRIISEFLIVVTDSAGKTHFLHPELDNVGFVEKNGIALSLLSSGAIAEGKVIVQLYKADTPENRQQLDAINSKNKERQQGIENTLAQINIPPPVIGREWKLAATTLNNHTVAELSRQANWTIFQVYSQFCGFCRQAIPRLNTLNNQQTVQVIGLAGAMEQDAFRLHMAKNNLHYPIVMYEGEYAESTLLAALGQNGFPTYLVVDNQNILRKVFQGTAALEQWIDSTPNITR